MAYDQAVATAKRILGNKGRSVVITRTDNGAFDEIAGVRAVGGNKLATFNCVALPPGRSAEYQIGSLIGRSILQFYLARTAGSIDPQPGDTITWAGKVYTFIWTATYDPDATGAIMTVAYGECA